MSMILSENKNKITQEIPHSQNLGIYIRMEIKTSKLKTKPTHNNDRRSKLIKI